MPTYFGACHCKAVRFEVDAEIDHLRVCDCSICSKRGGLMFRVSGEALRMLTPMESLSEYRWGTRTAVDYFCRTCGVLPFRRPSRLTKEEAQEGIAPFDGWAINTRCLEAFASQSLPIVRIAGSRLAMES